MAGNRVVSSKLSLLRCIHEARTHVWILTVRMGRAAINGMFHWCFPMPLHTPAASQTAQLMTLSAYHEHLRRRMRTRRANECESLLADRSYRSLIPWPKYTTLPKKIGHFSSRYFDIAHIPSSQPGLRLIHNLAYSRRITKIKAKPRATEHMMIYMSARGFSAAKSGITPGGGANAGTFLY